MFPAFLCSVSLAFVLLGEEKLLGWHKGSQFAQEYFHLIFFICFWSIVCVYCKAMPEQIRRLLGKRWKILWELPVELVLVLAGSHCYWWYLLVLAGTATAGDGTCHLLPRWPRAQTTRLWIICIVTSQPPFRRLYMMMSQYGRSKPVWCIINSQCHWLAIGGEDVCYIHGSINELGWRRLGVASQ